MTTKRKTSQIEIPWTGLATAFVWAISPIFIRLGLEGLDSPVVGVTIGLLANVPFYFLLLIYRKREWQGKPLPRKSFYWQLLAAVLVALATWVRYIALDTVPVAVVTAIVRISVPIVIVLSLLMLDQKHERVNWRVWVGGSMIVGGAMILTFGA